MRFVLMLILLFSFNFLNGQYNPLKSEGEIPKDFTTSSTIKYKNELESINQGAKRRTRKNEKRFYLESNFAIDDILQSGRVMFNDPVSKYVDEIAGVLLKNDLELKKQLRFYTVRTSSVNAFATNQGVVLINMGLIAHLENEAELAFILAHEISHYKEKHALEFYLDSKELDQTNSRKYFKKSDLDRKLAKNNFSKENESEADELGLKLFLESDYELESVSNAFDLLQYSYLSYDEMPFDKSYFEDDYIYFPKEYQLDSLQTISTEFEENDTHSTHPSLSKRKKVAKEIIGNISTDNRKKFIVSENDFYELRKKARYELLEYYLRNHEYYAAIYHAYLLQNEFPDDSYLKMTFAKAFYGMSKLRNADKFSDFKLYHSDIEGEYGSLVFFLNKLKTIELNALALRYAYLLKNDFGENTVFLEMIKDLCQDFINYYGNQLQEFQEGKYTQVINEEIKDSTILYSITHAFGDFIETEDFKKLVMSCEENKEIRAKQKEKEEQIKLKDRYMKNGDFALGEKKVLVINPFYLTLKKGKKGPNLIDSEKSQSDFNDFVKKYAESLNLKVTMLDAVDLKKNDVEAFNDIREIQEWFGQQIDNEEDFNMIAFNQERINEIARKYDVDTFVWIGLVSKKMRRNLWEIYGKFIFNQIEWLYGIINPKGQSLFFSIALDATNGKAKMVTFDLIPSLSQEDLIKQRLYDILGQIKRKSNN